MVRSVRYDSPAKVNAAVERGLADIRRDILRLQYRKAEEHVGRVGGMYADAVRSGLLPDGCEAAGVHPPRTLAALLAGRVRESDHAFVANASGFKKFAAGMDAVVVSVLRERLPEVHSVPEHADADFHIDFAGFVGRSAGETVGKLAVGPRSRISSLISDWISLAARRVLGAPLAGKRGEIERRISEAAVCLVPEFIAARGYELAALDRRTSGILRKMLEQCLTTEAPRDVALAFRQLDTLVLQAPQRHAFGS